MKLSIIIWLFSCVSLSMQYDCFWSGCEGLLHRGVVICKGYGALYSGGTSRQGCKWDTAKVQCCREDQSKPGCKWTGTCYGGVYKPSKACKNEFGANFKPSGRSLSCNGTTLRQKYYVCGENS